MFDGIIILYFEVKCNIFLEVLRRYYPLPGVQAEVKLLTKMHKNVIVLPHGASALVH